VLIVVGLVLAQDLPEMALVPDEGARSHLRTHVLLGAYGAHPPAATGPSLYPVGAENALHQFLDEAGTGGTFSAGTS
jgi:hypothetical protein